MPAVATDVSVAWSVRLFQSCKLLIPAIACWLIVNWQRSSRPKPNIRSSLVAVVKVAYRITVYRKLISGLRSLTSHIWDHTVLPATRHR